MITTAGRLPARYVIHTVGPVYSRKPGIPALLAACHTNSLVLAVTHALPVRYVLDAADGLFPAAQIGPVPHATPFPLGVEAVERAAQTLRVWAAAPRFADLLQDPPFDSPHRAL